ncbi:Rne/Rng family ribonuclease [Rickettsiales endosymbiont of Peranema trichophorum]|uniref:Rne/Rng family ribonuclease n=1 Tax=Rickettsiales endosymbiont of Peranema trichophorum TaxID=2486577 RepID=UPI001022A163|nr:Rne/Rng family ribonuclease [Rickettsiales endosymbiont of Peranema trichophorum]RZI47275.1 Rne/Rng family ribonuclease [Rickettsiales endosymbiont of Peranema trichophorum]
MSKLMLIDAAHAEETRVVVLNNKVIEEFEYQNTYKKSIKGNIYLAKVMRVEPALQAAFVDYGGDKLGFLPFSEIEPSYYHIPTADKEVLLRSLISSEQSKDIVLSSDQKMEEFEIDEDEKDNEEIVVPNDMASTASEGEDGLEGPLFEKSPGDDTMSEKIQDEVLYSKPDFYKNYKIQEVIKKDQIMLVQVTKEERGNKGASVTTYIGLAGRYCVLMPNSFGASGVSRKLLDAGERQRLKLIAEELSNKAGKVASIIIRTAGSYKTRAEIKRDFNYLTRLWNNIREHTLASSAPTFIHEEGDVVKKSIRDIYSSDIEQILVSGEEAYKSVKQFMESLLPTHVSKIKPYKGRPPLFVKYEVEKQLSALYDNVVTLKSGGYLVINHTEALVAIDVNSGRAVTERDIEGTALKTNLEAVSEIARQLKLRDLSGLIVIDFIDMDGLKNKKTVERAFMKAVSDDRAKVQIGRIGMFGLMEMTRQRLRTSFMESNTQICTSCNGRGRIRPVEATAVAVFRALDAEVSAESSKEVKVSGSSKLILYILNNKRNEIIRLEKASKSKITFYIDEEAGEDGFFLEAIDEKSEDIVGAPTALSVIDSEPYALSQQQSDANDSGYRKRWKEKSTQEPPKETPTPEEPVERGERVRQSKRYKKGHKNKRAQDVEQSHSSHVPSNADDEDGFEENMATKREENYSLLKEIWRKIIK